MGEAAYLALHDCQKLSQSGLNPHILRFPVAESRGGDEHSDRLKHGICSSN